MLWNFTVSLFFKALGVWRYVLAILGLINNEDAVHRTLRARYDGYLVVKAVSKDSNLVKVSIIIGCVFFASYHFIMSACRRKNQHMIAHHTYYF